MVEKTKGKDKKKTAEEITFYHKAVFEVPKDGSDPFLKGYRCKKCNKLWFPMVKYCMDSKCWSDDLEPVRLSRTGKIYTCVDIYIGAPGITTPYVWGYVDLPDGIRIPTMFDGDIKTFEIGDEVELVAKPIRKNSVGDDIISWKFRKVT
jgi:benzoylsuccinyl-CoA thiolase BbsA subunit